MSSEREREKWGVSNDGEKKKNQTEIYCLIEENCKYTNVDYSFRNLFQDLHT